MKILLLTGESGSGKTTIASKLIADEHFHLVKSFTDRPHRTVTTDLDHQFISSPMMDFILTYKVVASTTIDGYRYCSTFRQFDKNKINIYVVDKKGLDDVKTSFEDATIYSVLIKKDNIDIDQNRKNRHIIVPTENEVDFVFRNNTDDYSSIEDFKNIMLNYFGE